MNRKLQFIAAITAALFIALIPYLRSSHETRDQAAEAPASVRPPPVSPGAVATAPPDPSALQNVSPHPLAVSFGENPDLAVQEPAILLEILQFYRMEFGSFPAGQENRDIMNALTGNNPDKLPIFPSKHPRIDAKGNLLDAWGNPFVFHPVDSQYLEVRSHGPDGEIFTDDDIVVPRPVTAPSSR
jgi:hypothetical protein